MLDINLFREEKGHNPEIIRESQRRRFASVELVDEVFRLDKEWRQRQFELENLRKDFNKINKQVAKLRLISEDATEMIKNTEDNEKSTAEKETEVREALKELNSRLEIIGNLVHDSVPVNNDEANNAVIRSWGEKRVEPKLKNHVELVELVEIADLKKGTEVAGGRGYYPKGAGVLLNQALINFVTGEGDDKYLIATAEQPLCAYHLDDWIHPSQLPLRYAGYSSCFRKEAGSHGRDTLGIFRVHQFEKVEQFCLTSPNGNDSWDMHEEMIKNSEDFYMMLNIPHQVVAIISDYQSRRLEIQYGQNKQQRGQFCCILENNQKEDGVEIPEALRPFMGGKTFLPFKSKPASEGKGKESKA
ncbi:hypothetical protein FNV43_RR05035 [Rhamnella rubrinervis]|uniref:serine--tRNA ligase n=1 Tax=Rhamnella rubrinervis TaxID=2594499 RepID=A0A8K0HKV9_9ROSA|nr:hypothetical protein FNV43_RR05035 [Rhamnella rubrinervis]